MDYNILRNLPFGTRVNIKWIGKYAKFENENYDGVIVKGKIYYEDGKYDGIEDLIQFENGKFEYTIES